jgi:hypothetical protein
LKELAMAAPLPASAKPDYLPKEIAELRQELEHLPRSLRDRMLPLCDRVCHFIYLQSRLLEVAQETVDRLQLDVKYLMFDVDMTKRERDLLRDELENQAEGM